MDGKLLSMNVGLALSGGGARGMGHLGTVKALMEKGITFKRMAGTSAGAIVSAFLCAGYKPDEILDIVNKTKLLKYVRPAMTVSGLLKLEMVAEIFDKYLPVNFEDLKIPLTVAATDLKKGKNKYFSSGALVPAVLASCAVPIIFKPILIDGVKYIDGGILNNLPVDPLIGQCDRIIGCNCNPINESFEDENLKSLMERSLMMAINVNTYYSKPKCDLFIEAPGMQQFGAFEFSQAEEMMRVSYEYTKANADKFLARLLESD